MGYLKIMKVEQFKVANQFHIYNNDTDILQSYDSKVVEVKHITEDNEHVIDFITLGCDWDYSNTTRKYVYLFLEEYSDLIIPYNEKNKRAYIQKLIDSNEIQYNENMR